jgi:division protein CdvB (Snf7/Vps24/ESCRT-III family)
MEITNASTVINNQLSKLRMLEEKFSRMDDKFSAEISNLVRSGNNSRAKTLVNELVNVRRVRNTTRNMSLTLEMLVIRLSTIKDFGVIMDTIEPTIDMIKGIQVDISAIVPAATGAISEMSEVSSGVLNTNLNIERWSDIPNRIDSDALDILAEVETAMEKDAKIKLPDIPSEIKESTVRSTDNSNLSKLIRESEVLVET